MGCSRDDGRGPVVYSSEEEGGAARFFCSSARGDRLTVIVEKMKYGI